MKKLKVLIGGAFACGLIFTAVGCKEADKPTGVPTVPTVTPTEVAKKSFTISLEGERLEGGSLAIKAIGSENEVVKITGYKALAGKELIKLEGSTISLLKAGKVELVFMAEGYNDAKIEFEILAKPAPEKKLALSYKGHAFKGETLTLSVLDGDKEVEDCNISIIKGADFTVKNGNRLALLDKGIVTLEISKDGYETLKEDIEVMDVLTISQVKADLNTYAGKMVNVRGRVTSTYGNTFYIMDGKDGFLVYNIQANPMFGSAGDAFELGQINVDKNVIVSAYVENGKYGLQLSGFQAGGYELGCQVNLSNAEIREPEPYIVRTEAELAALAKDPTLAGSRVRITGKFLSGDFSSAEQQSPKSPLFKMLLGKTGYSLKFDKIGSLEKVKSYWNKERILENEFVTVEANFTNFKQKEITLSLCNEGTIVINETKNPNRMKIKAAGNQVIQGNTLELSVTEVPGITNVTYKAIDGGEFVSIKGNVLTGVKPGSAVIVAVSNDSESLPFEVVVTKESYQTVAEALALDKGSTVNVRGNVIAITKFGFIVGDETGYIYAYDEAFDSTGVQKGDTIALSGRLDIYAKTNEKQVVGFKAKSLDEKLSFTPEFTKKTPEELLKITAEASLRGIPVSMSLALEASDAFNGYALFTHPALGNVRVECNSLPFDLSGALGFGAEGQAFDIKGVIIGAYTDKETNELVYIIYITELAEATPAPVESLAIEATKTTIALDGTTGAGRCMVTINANPFNADMSTVELVAITNPELVTIEYDDWTGEYKVKSNGTEGVVTIVARSGDIVSNEITITIAK